MRELGSVLGADEMAIAEFLIGNLDEQGLSRRLFRGEDAAMALGVEPPGRRPTELQQQEPVGIGARDLKECLLLQLDFLEGQGITCPHVRDRDAPPGAARRAQV